MDRKNPTRAGGEGKSAGINCFACRHFYITYDRSFPYGCRKVGFKSRLIPSREMHANSGLECQLFEEKDKKG